jgi:hypothetical protein
MLLAGGQRNIRRQLAILWARSEWRQTREHSMALERISFLDAYWLLERQTGGVLPPETLDASWFASDDRNVVGVVISDTRNKTWRYVLFERRGFELPYMRSSAGQELATCAAAKLAMQDDAHHQP